jgi:hypothetical protein
MHPVKCLLRVRAMTIEQWNIVLSSIIAVLMVIYGIWLKYVIDQQLKAKDAAIQALEAGLKAKDSEISRLERDAAPAIVADYTTVRQYANSVTEQRIQLQGQLDTLSSEHQRHRSVAPAELLLSEVGGLQIASGLIVQALERFGSAVQPSPDSITKLVQDIVDVAKQIQHEIGSRIAKITGLVDAIKSSA